MRKYSHYTPKIFTTSEVLGNCHRDTKTLLRVGSLYRERKNF
nr:MAG TPA: hypothetical protein [Caudoviricetes sp.]